MSHLGNLFLASSLEEAATVHYQKWETTYLAEIERLRGLDAQAVPRVKSMSVKNELGKFPEEQLPALVVVSPGISEGSVRTNGDGEYDAAWDLGVAVISSGIDEESTNLLRGIYGAAIRGMFLQHPEIEELGYVEEWVDESYTDVDIDVSRTKSVVQVIFRVRVESVVLAHDGTREPLADPYATHEFPEVDDIDFEMAKHGD